MRTYRADLHIHTALSPCASEEMTPRAIVRAAMEAGLDMIAISDHNSAGNIAAVQGAAAAVAAPEEPALTVIPGMEITSMEEVHVLGLFPDVAAAEGVAETLRSLLPAADEQYYAYFGDQPLLAEDGRVLSIEKAALATAVPLDLNETVELIHQAGGRAIAAHVDRHSFSVSSQLGFFPEDAGFDGVEVSRHLGAGSPLLDQFSRLGLAVTGSSDGHFLDEIGTAYSNLRLASPSFAELAMALAGAGERSVSRA